MFVALKAASKSLDNGPRDCRPQDSSLLPQGRPQIPQLGVSTCIHVFGASYYLFVGIHYYSIVCLHIVALKITIAELSRQSVEGPDHARAFKDPELETCPVPGSRRALS